MKNLSTNSFSANPALREIWSITRLVKSTYGFNLGLMQFTYQVFLYDHFGSNQKALSWTVSLLILLSIFILLAEVPTGALGDYLGRKKTIVLCFVVATVAYFFRTWIYFVPSPFYSLILAVFATIFYALSYTLFSGCFTAWIVDSVRGCQGNNDYGPILARAASHMMLAKILGAAIGLSLYLMGYVYYAFSLGTLIAMHCAIYCSIKMKETKAMQFHSGKLFLEDSIHKMKKIMVDGFKITLKTPPLMFMMFMTASFMMLINVVNALWPIAMKANFGVTKMSPYWFIIVFTGMLSAYLGTKILEWLQHKQTKKSGKSIKALWSWFLVVCLLMAITVYSLGFSSLKGAMTLTVFIMAFAVFNLCYGFLLPADDTLMNHFIKTEHSQERATIMSWSSMLIELLMIIFLFPSSGPSGKETAVGWMLPSGILIVLTIAIYFLMRRYQRKVSELPDGTELMAVKT